jgi:hypothetical protein
MKASLIYLVRETLFQTKQNETKQKRGIYGTQEAANRRQIKRWFLQVRIP